MTKIMPSHNEKFKTLVIILLALTLIAAWSLYRSVYFGPPVYYSDGSNSAALIDPVMAGEGEGDGGDSTDAGNSAETGAGCGSGGGAAEGGGDGEGGGDIGGGWCQ